MRKSTAISGKSRLVKYYHFARRCEGSGVWCDKDDRRRTWKKHGTGEKQFIRTVTVVLGKMPIFFWENIWTELLDLRFRLFIFVIQFLVTSQTAETTGTPKVLNSNGISLKLFSDMLAPTKSHDWVLWFLLDLEDRRNYCDRKPFI